MLMPILDGKAVLYSFVTAPDVRIGVAFGSGGSQSLPATELPGVSSWLVCVLLSKAHNNLDFCFVCYFCMLIQLASIIPF